MSMTGISGDPATVPWTDLAEYAHQLGITEPIDVSDVRGRNRVLTRLFASVVYAAIDPFGGPRYAGLRYLSRLDTTWECWAIFEEADVIVGPGRAIEQHDADMQAVATKFKLTIF